MTASHRKIIIGTCRVCGRLWLVSSKAKTAAVCECGGALTFAQTSQPPAGVGGMIVKPAKEAQTIKVVAMPRHEPPEKIELPAWIEPLPLSDYRCLMLAAECGSFVLSGSPPREEFKTGELITLISRLWGMALWLEYGKFGGEDES